MRRIILIALLALTALGGVASADRRAPYVRDHRGGVYVQPHSPRHDRYRSPRYVVRPSVRATPRYYVQPSYRYVRRPIYVQRPVIAVRYYNYYQRPALIAESYPPMAGYTWVAGQWIWNGYEWIWNPGHYEPDPAYNGGYYDSSYDNSGSTYYDAPYSY